MHGWLRGLFAVLAGSLFVLPAVPAAQTESGAVMMVLDASGSMWGQIEGTSKVVIAREAIGDLLADWDSNLELGLITYGHRRKDDCSDIETLIPVGEAAPAAVAAAVTRIQPKGMTPLSAAVRRAAKELKYTEEKATVILLSDGRETCGADPCAVGTDLEKLGVDFTAHVIGFDVTKEEETGLRCLAETTGGEYLAASDAAGLRAALGRTVTNVTADCESTPNLSGKWSYALCNTCPRRGLMEVSQERDSVALRMRWDPNPTPGWHYEIRTTLARADCTLNGSWEYLLDTPGYDQGGRYFARVRPDGLLLVVSKTDDRGAKLHNWNGSVYYLEESQPAPEGRAEPGGPIDPSK